MDSSLNARWYVIQTKPYKEILAKEQLEVRGVNCYLPMAPVLAKKILQRKNNMPIDKGEPFFPRYIFAEFDVESIHTTRVKSTPGVSSIVSFGGVPATMMNSEISELKKGIAQMIPKLLAAAIPAKGDHVEIISGSFEGLSAIFEKMEGETRSTLLMELLGKKVRRSVKNCDFKFIE